MTARVILAPIAWVALLLAATIQVAWLWQPVPWLLRVAPVLLTALTWQTPRTGLVMLAGLLPISGGLVTLAGRADLNNQFLEQLALAVITGAALSLRRQPAHSPLAGPVMVFGVVFAVSAIVAQPPLLLRDLTGQAPSTFLWDLLARGYFERWPTWTPVVTAALVIEGSALAVTTERVVALHPATLRSVVTLFAISTAALAVSNLERIVGAALRSGDFLGALPNLMVGVRVSRFYDVNAAGSVFVLAAFSSVGLLVDGRRWRWWAGLPLVFILMGLWISGSRTAIAILGAVALTAAVAYGLASRGRGRLIAGVAVAALLVAAASLVAFYPTGRNLSASGAYRARVILGEVALSMWRSAPVLGVGAGRFHAESSQFGGEALRRELNFASENENAHNYFLQVLAETGAVGLASLLAILAVPLRAAWGAARREKNPFHIWLGVGLAAYVLTWLTGHPQLVAASALLFWPLFGAFAGGSGLTATPGVRIVAAFAVLAVLATSPWRVSRAFSDADLEHVGMGLSAWHHTSGDVPYREAGRAFDLYLPADGTVAALPMRHAPGLPSPVRVRITARDTVIREVELSDTWREIALSLEPRGRRFELVRFEVVDAALADAVWVQIGRARPR